MKIGGLSQRTGDFPLHGLLGTGLGKDTCTLCPVNTDFLVQEGNIDSVGIGGRKEEEV